MTSAQKLNALQQGLSSSSSGLVGASGSSSARYSFLGTSTATKSLLHLEKGRKKANNRPAPFPSGQDSKPRGRKNSDPTLRSQKHNMPGFQVGGREEGTEALLQAFQSMGHQLTAQLSQMEANLTEPPGHQDRSAEAKRAAARQGTASVDSDSHGKETLGIPGADRHGTVDSAGRSGRARSPRPAGQGAKTKLDVPGLNTGATSKTKGHGHEAHDTRGTPSSPMATPRQAGSASPSAFRVQHRGGPKLMESTVERKPSDRGFLIESTVDRTPSTSRFPAADPGHSSSSVGSERRPSSYWGSSSATLLVPKGESRSGSASPRPRPVEGGGVSSEGKSPRLRPVEGGGALPESKSPRLRPMEAGANFAGADRSRSSSVYAGDELHGHDREDLVDTTRAEGPAEALTGSSQKAPTWSAATLAKLQASEAASQAAEERASPRPSGRQAGPVSSTQRSSGGSTSGSDGGDRPRSSNSSGSLAAGAEECHAATKIQAAVRGSITRRQLSTLGSDVMLHSF